MVIPSSKGLFVIDGYNNLDQLKEINFDVKYESNNVIFWTETDQEGKLQEGAYTILIAGTHGNQLHSHCISDPF